MDVILKNQPGRQDKHNQTPSQRGNGLADRLFTRAAPASPEVTHKHVWDPFSGRGFEKVRFEIALLAADHLSEWLNQATDINMNAEITELRVF